MNAVAVDVRRKLGWRYFQSLHHGLFDLGNGLVERVGNLAVRHLDFLGDARHQVPAPDLVIIGRCVQLRQRRADGDFDHLGRPLADEQVMFATHVVHDVAGKNVPGNAHRLLAHDAR